MLSAVGVSLSEFADSMIVGQLLNSDAFAIVNLGTPVVFLTCMIYTLTGLGGSLLYAEYLGKKEKDKADEVFTASSVIALFAGVLLFILLMIFSPCLGSLFGCPEKLKVDFDRYIRILCLFVPVSTVLMNLTFYLPIIGMPYLSSGLVVSANVLNIVLDIVLIRGFGMGCEGAATATLISYLVVLAAGLLICAVRKAPLSLRKIIYFGNSVLAILKKGLPSGIVQAGYAVTTIFCNYFMNLSFGMEGVVAMSLFAQMDSVISIALTGIVDNNASFAAMLKGEGDYYGIRSLTKHVAVMIFSVCSVISVCLTLFSRNIAAVFNITDEGSLSMIAVLTPIYVLYYPPRSLLLLLRDIYNTIDRSAYAMVLGIIDKSVSIPLVGGILYLVFGGYGVIVAFSLSVFLILMMIAIVNRRIVRKSNGRYSFVLLLDEQYPLKALCSFTVDYRKNPAQAGRDIEKSLKEYSVNPAHLNKICLAVEEICTYFQKHNPSDVPADIMISSYGNSLIITCHSIGQPFYPFDMQNSANNENELLLTEMFHIKHEYILGLNSTSLTIGNHKHE